MGDRHRARMIDWHNECMAILVSGQDRTPFPPDESDEDPEPLEEPDDA